jgi:hypothetical protein|tara:strand:- start:239 stop:757 length:519 start_codon:yes stop_codon:yes gene_type:complete
MIDSNFKIVLYNGGFAGDLITALYSPDVVNRLENNTVVLYNKFRKLKLHSYRQKASMDEKIKYLKSIEKIGACSSHDLELSLRFRKNTHMVYCSDDEMVKEFYKRAVRDKDHQIMSVEEQLEWQISGRRIFENQVDLAKANQPDFLDKLNIHNEKSKEILKEWLKPNGYIYK